jgi:hypothetical protein
MKLAKQNRARWQHRSRFGTKLAGLPVRGGDPRTTLENDDDQVIGSGIAGKFTAWTRVGRVQMAIVEGGLLGMACTNLAYLPSKNMIWSAKVVTRRAPRGVRP